MNRRGRISCSGPIGPMLWHAAHYRSKKFVVDVEPSKQGIRVTIWAKEG